MKKYKLIQSEYVVEITEKDKDEILRKNEIVGKNMFVELESGSLINVIYTHNIKDGDKDLIDQTPIKL